MPFWLRIVAAIGIVAFIGSFMGGLFGADGWWQASGTIFAVALTVVTFYRMRQQESASAAEPEEGGDHAPPGKEPPR